MKTNGSVLRKVQLTELEVLDEIDRVCKKYNINYYLVGGTLLGAVRHKGFIPWDDDIDIAMLRNDYNRFISVCISDKALDDKYYLHTIETDPEYHLPFMKVRKNNTTFAEKDLSHIKTHKGIYVDIFPYDNAKKEKSISQRIRGFLTKNIIEVVFVKKGIRKIEECHRPKVVKILNIFSLKFLTKLQYRLCIKNNKRDTKYIINYVGDANINNASLKLSGVIPNSTLNFEGKEYPVFKDYETYLIKNYGDYMKLPKVKDRKNHMPKKIDFEVGENRQTKRP